ncbi:MAG: ribosome recycling factor [Proteobacteria bacterium]|jgi:ribosome recycling factor|nr:ribosome recycling factor [Alphaproteobacteria bacterium]NCC02891.1 ribosome recycling factor [Pseudomonadota bacterium]
MDLEKVKQRMDGAVESLHREFAGLRTGRAAASMLDPVMVEAYGSKMPLNQVGSVNVPEPRLLTVQVWDKGMVKAVEKAIRECGLGFNPQADGTLIRVPVPDLSSERRTELTKVAGKYTEAARVAARNVRRDAMDMIKKQEKAGEISEDELKTLETKIQELTDKAIKAMDEALAHKEKEIMTV